METLVTSKIQSWLVWFLRGVLILGFFILSARLVDLQLIRGKYFRNLAEGNRVRRVPISAPRGRILARGGEIIVGNKRVQKRVVFDPESGFQKSESIEGVLQEELITEWVRDYIMGEAAVHLTGYLGEVREDELGKIRAQCPEHGPRRLGSWVGRSGLEEQYDCILSGVEGEELVEVDAQGVRVRTLGRRNPIPGEDLKTTIDFGLQEKVAQLMREKGGAIVITDAQGGVLALYSSPPYDPDVLIGVSETQEPSEILNNKSLPLLNRAIGGKFHPGSVFKPIVGVAALAEEKIDETFTYEDTGKINIETPYGNFSYTNWYFNQYGGVEGTIGLTRAIARSTDTFFYKLGELLGAEKLSEWAQKFKLDDESGIDLPGEVAGLVPNPEWKLKVKGERWFLGNTYHMTIGQGDIALTPLGVNQAISTIASGGRYCVPHIINYEELEKSRPKDDQSLAEKIKKNNRSEDRQNSKCRDLGIKKENIYLVKKGMMDACSSGGTGFTFFDFKEKSGVEVACKTGTAETERGEPHAWFVAFAPADEPQIVATVLVENGGEGSRVAGPIARQIFDYWFKVNSPTPANDR